MRKSSIMLFLLTYGLFYLSSILFPINRFWYIALQKPPWTSSGMIIGII
ncbi:Protein of unknown function [Bacillus thuringiensis]|uniref:VanZ family protein n=1 Tax=Bacillus thuringiensis TaxID=1428 RepID=A0A1C4DWW9_BACTU|nr:Protein of unknown function [Bacillus thuringiensis]